jgi:hypothetical protein
MIKSLVYTVKNIWLFKFKKKINHFIAFLPPRQKRTWVTSLGNKEFLDSYRSQYVWLCIKVYLVKYDGTTKLRLGNRQGLNIQSFWHVRTIAFQSKPYFSGQHRYKTI